jgi:hypothetical protein
VQHQLGQSDLDQLIAPVQIGAPAGPATPRLRNECLAVPSGANGSEARISSCVDSFNDQWWTFLNTIPASDSVLLRNHKTGKCLVGRTANGRNGKQLRVEFPRPVVVLLRGVISSIFRAVGRVTQRPGRPQLPTLPHLVTTD